MTSTLTAFILAVIGSNALTALVTALFGRRRLHAETMGLSVKTALELEERATTRYKTASEALDVAQAALNTARAEIRSLEDYIEVLHGLLDMAGIKYPSQPQLIQ